MPSRTPRRQPAELGQSWNEVLDRSRELGLEVAAALAAAASTENERWCLEKLTRCLENVWQPEWNREQFGPRKNCPACFRMCKRTGEWPTDKCPP